MIMGLTFDAASGTAAGSLRTPAITAREDATWVRPPRAPAARAPVPPPDDVPEIGRGLAPMRAWNATKRPLRRIEDAFAVALLLSLLTLGTLTFGYAFDSLATAQAASVPAARN